MPVFGVNEIDPWSCCYCKMTNIFFLKTLSVVALSGIMVASLTQILISWERRKFKQATSSTLSGKNMVTFLLSFIKH